VADLDQLLSLASQPIDEGEQSPGAPEMLGAPWVFVNVFSVSTLQNSHIFSHTAKFGFYFHAAFDLTPTSGGAYIMTIWFLYPRSTELISCLGFGERGPFMSSPMHLLFKESWRRALGLLYVQGPPVDLWHHWLLLASDCPAICSASKELLAAHIIHADPPTHFWSSK